MRVVGLPSTSTFTKFGRLSAKGPKSKASRFMARKFSPLIHIRSAEPSLRAAAFSARTRFTTSAVSASLTCSSLMPKARCTSAPAHCR